MTDEPRYSRYLRGVMEVFTPAGMDGFILGLAVAAVPFVLWLYLTGD